MDRRKRERTGEIKKEESSSPSPGPLLLPYKSKEKITRPHQSMFILLDVVRDLAKGLMAGVFPNS